MTTDPDDDLVPVSVRLGAVVPAEDPEDWTRPLTWVAAVGMLAGPLVTLVWFLVARPTTDVPTAATYGAAAILASGAALTGATQQGVTRAWTATLGAGLFGALVVVILGVVLAGERAVGSAPPTVTQSVMVALAGLGGTVAASVIAAAVASSSSRAVRLAVPAVTGAIGALAVGWLIG